ncbi:NAD(P)-dependent dehydrogenase (short-subunit alcohol dehydrogenase family) [Pseudoduganella lurida]|uniref:NAD(P)-dependent dehydrogenase (Short-subunit alcohol dehydrogenase family) n=1 Tax=Pseudoduganella lurida TaxID=1036180 RepID=A0A562RM94_9BURK|nr:glucose 1-dehydrogenase [Pseudoduganella lurida]TWI69734.1 NAD(P)-dependent dehydrogenase (short-subunit alcohol dehydrogenase family) [Pseudoduganella lurida]
MFDLNGKRAVVTGAGSGIGRAIATLFAAQGAHVAVLDIGEAAAREVVEEIRGAGGQATAHACNVTRQADVIATFDAIGPIDILVNNAGIAHIGKADTTAEADFDRVIDVNVKGVYNCLHAGIPGLRANGGGVIVNMASVAAWVGVSERFAYSTAKGAVMAMTLSVAKDCLADRIRCNSISPGRVHTPFVDGFLAKNYAGREAEMFEKLSKTQPIGRMARPDEVAKLALYLCSDDAAFITGTDYPIDGGFITLQG